MIIHLIAHSLNWITEKTTDFVQEIIDQYGRAIRKKYPWVIVKKQCTMWDPVECKGHSSKNCSYAIIGRDIVCPNDLKDGGKEE